MTKKNCYICNAIIIDNETDPKNPIYHSYSETRIIEVPPSDPGKPFKEVALCSEHEKAAHGHWIVTAAKVYKPHWTPPGHV